MIKALAIFFGAVVAASVELLVAEIRSPKVHDWMEAESRGEVYIILVALNFALLTAIFYW